MLTWLKLDYKKCKLFALGNQYSIFEGSARYFMMILKQEYKGLGKLRE